MTETMTSTIVTTAAGLMLLTAVLQTWRRSSSASVRLLVVQGLALAAMVAALGLRRGSVELVIVAALVGAVKAGILPWALGRTSTGKLDERDSSAKPATGLIGAAVLTIVAYTVSAPLRSLSGSSAVPAGIALVLIGFWLLLTRHTAVSQLVGFVVLDNGIAMVAFLTSDGLPLTVELGATLDVLLVVVILRTLTTRMRATHGGTSVDDLRELKD
jgi:hydrogenase-4 component E